MKERLTNNLVIKLLSVGIALILWILVVNLSNPVITKVISDIPLEVLNEDVLTDAGLTYEIDGKKTVSVTVQVETLNYNKIQKSDFRAYVDLNNLWSVTRTVPVQVETVSNKGLLKSDPVPTTDVIHVVTEPIQEKTFPVQIYTTGTPSDGYAPGTQVAEPSTVTVKGPESLVGQIHSVGVTIDIEGKDGDVSGNSTPIFYDANSHEITDSDFKEKVTVDTDQIAYTQVILRIKELALNFEITGQVAEGYRFTGTSSEYKSVPVAGYKSVLAELTSLQISDPELSLDGLTADKTVRIDLNKYLPSSSLSLAGMESSIISVTLRVEPLVSQDYTLSTAEVTMTGQDSDYTYSFDEKTIEVTVQGLEEDLNQLDASQLRATIDVTNMQEGSNEGSLAFDLDDSFVVQSYSPFTITVTAKNNAASPSQQTTGANTASESDGIEETETQE
ncbi:MAG: CdaR family protein [bacterium]|nr:CdaR family protein [bacterium]